MSSVYERSAPVYNAVSRLLVFERKLRNAAAQALGAPERVLDVGCGTGFQFAHLPASTRHVIGVDISPSSLAVAHQVAAKRGLAFIGIVGDMADTILPAHSFDAAIGVFSMSVIPRWEMALTRCVKAVKPGGKIVLLEQERVTRGTARLFNPLAQVVNQLLGADNTRSYGPTLEAMGCSVEKHPAWGGLYALTVAVKPKAAAR
ncbi:MAG: class I SAM-dependent methyltransferase [Myxococcaceae bacterium]|nr:class I SAM-dependent methyltransferase [Myxococcaceae bacterium]